MIEVADARRQLTDAEVLTKSVEEPEVFETLFERYFHDIHRYLRLRGGAAADDVAAETFAVAFRRRADFDRSRTDARPWLYGIATNLARDGERRRRRQVFAFGRAPRDNATETEEEATVARLDAWRARADLDGVLAELAPGERELLVLHACAELSYEELAKALAIPLGTVRSRLHRVRKKARGELERRWQRQQGDADEI